MQNDIFTKCIDPADYLSLKELKDKSKEDQDEVMSEEPPVIDEQQLSSDKPNFEEDYYQCQVAKPKNAADFPY